MGGVEASDKVGVRTVQVAEDTKMKPRIALKWRRDSCQALDDDGNKCHKQAVQSVRAHLDPEINCDVGWVQARLCKEHGGVK